MKVTRSSKIAALALTASATMALAACGGESTVENTATNASAPAVPTVSTSAQAPSEGTPAPSSAPEEESPRSDEGPATEVAGEPEAQPMPEAENAYIKSLQDGGVDVRDYDVLLVSTGQGVCSGETVTRDVVVGQLIEQQRTTLAPDALTRLIDDSARAHLCP